MTINIIAYQQDEDNTYRFIYQLEGSLDMHVASCMNYNGISDLLRYSQATKVYNSINLYDYIQAIIEDRELQLNIFDSTLGQAE